MTDTALCLLAAAITLKNGECSDPADHQRAVEELATRWKRWVLMRNGYDPDHPGNQPFTPSTDPPVDL